MTESESLLTETLKLVRGTLWQFKNPCTNMTDTVVSIQFGQTQMPYLCQPYDKRGVYSESNKLCFVVTSWNFTYLECINRTNQNK